MSESKLLARRTKVKICGLTRKEDVEAVNCARPEYIGFVFAPSRRRVDRETAGKLKAMLDPGIEAVGVFVNEDIRFIARIYREGVIDLVQLHGDEDDLYIRRLKEHCGCRVIKAIGVGEELPALPETPDFLLFDTLTEQRGGAGRAFGWNLLHGYNGLPFFLAGGLSAANAAEALRHCAPYCADVSSGVETDGRKDIEKINAFISSVREAKG